MDEDLEIGQGSAPEPSPPATAGEIKDTPECSSVGEQRGKEKEEIPTRRDGSLVSIYKVPSSLAEISLKAIEPEMVFIGPYHSDKRRSSEFENTKHWYVCSLLDRTKRKKEDYYTAMRDMEGSTRSCYADVSKSTGDEFVEMMVLDGCFIIELLERLNSEDMEKGDPILSKPWLIPIVTRDLLKLQNQLPFSVLQKLHDISTNQQGEGYSLALRALNLFNNSLYRPNEVLKKSLASGEPKHLLDLVYSSFIPQNPSDPSTKKKEKKKNSNDPSQKYRPSSESIQCTVQLRSSWINFKPQRADSFLEINFQGKICKELQIPPITVNDFTTTLFINCMAWEQCCQNIPTWFTAYIAFMCSLITSPRDVTFLCFDGIITTGFSQNDHTVAELFKKLGEKVGYNVRQCYLSKQIRDVENYYSGYRGTFMRTYFSHSWSIISVLYALILLLLTGAQTAFSVLSYFNKDSQKNAGN